MDQPRRKEMELAMSTNYEGGKWHVTLQAWCGSESACDALIKTLEIVKPLLAENAAAKTEDATLA